jgi:hypothetical protein
MFGAAARVVAASLLVVLTAGAAHSQQSRPIEWSENASSLRGQTGQRFVFSCPPDGTTASARGTDVYTADSSICTAAVHALPGFTAANGGTIRIEIAAGQSAYRGSVRNGVTTAAAEAYDGSFIVIGALGRGAPSTTNPIRISWVTTAEHLGDADVLVLIPTLWLRCPESRYPYAVWGTDVYTTDSSICTAAVHAGQIDPQGGRFAIRVEDGRSSYPGSTRNRVESQTWAAEYDRSFSFASNPTAAPAPPPLMDIRVCVIDERGLLADVAAKFNPVNGDTTVAGKPFVEVYPTEKRYAADARWYIDKSPLTIAGRRWVKYGLPRVIGSNELTHAANHEGVTVFVEAGVALDRVEVIYLPVRPGCEFQPYQIKPKK